MTRFESGFAVALLLASLTLPLADAQARTLQQVMNVGTLRIGAVLASPWVMRNSDGELTGFEVDIARRLAADLDVEPQFVFYDFDEVVPALESGEIDIVISGLTITPERARHVNFSQPYAVGGVAIATNLSTTREVSRFEDLSDGAYRIGALDDSVAGELARRMLPDAELVPFETQADAAAALVDGDIDAYLDEQPAPTFLALEYPGLIDLPIGRPLLETRSAFAVAKGDVDFIAFLNAWIEAREADTFLTSTHRYWFESLRWRE
jgi:polar amino acid transport system substrate-binding protein